VKRPRTSLFRAATKVALFAVMWAAAGGCGATDARGSGAQRPESPQLALEQRAEHPAPPVASVGRIQIYADGYVARDWPRSTAYMESEEVIVYPLYWSNGDRPRPYSDGWSFLMDPGIFLFDTLLAPVRAVLTPPWTPTPARGGTD